MSETGSAVVIGGTRGIGRRLAEHLAAQGRQVVLTGRDRATAADVASTLGASARGLSLDLLRPDSIATALADVGAVSRLVLAGVARATMGVRNFEHESAIRVLGAKTVGYSQVLHVLASRLEPDAAVLVMGGLAKDRPDPGSLLGTLGNGAVAHLVRAVALELAPVRVNGLHPAIVRDSPYGETRSAAELETARHETPTGRLVTLDDVAHAGMCLLDNSAINGVNLVVDGGLLLG
jgi:NAD(P)-dependent dehydrogenase (short-subunit alcohol dehydrogenase family)